MASANLTASSLALQKPQVPGLEPTPSTSTAQDKQGSPSGKDAQTMLWIAAPWWWLLLTLTCYYYMIFTAIIIEITVILIAVMIMSILVSSNWPVSKFDLVPLLRLPPWPQWPMSGPQCQVEPKGLLPSTQRTPYPLIKEYTLNHNIKGISLN